MTGRYRNTRKLLTFFKIVLCSSLVASLLIVILLSNSSLKTDQINRSTQIQAQIGLPNKKGYECNEKYQVLCIIVPFRDRFEELLEFVPFIHSFLKTKSIEYKIIVVNQIDSLRFNRASLINVGFLYGTRNLTSPCSSIVMHDVDLLPLNVDLPYEFNETLSVMHISAPGLHPTYNYSNFLGGILLVPSNVFSYVDGMSNLYWGWGLEDDEFNVRLKQAGIIIKRPIGITTGSNRTFKHNHLGSKKRDHVKCFDQFNKTRRRDRNTGLTNVNYTIKSVVNVIIEKVPVLIVNTHLYCNTDISPWCDCPKVKSSAKVPSSKLKKKKV